MDFLNPLRWLMLLGLVMALWVGYHVWEAHQQGIGEERAEQRWKLRVAEQKTDAANALAVETNRALKAERELQDARQAQEKRDAQNRATIADLQGRLAAAAGPAGRLRDPFAQASGCGGGGSGAPAAPASAASSGGADGSQAAGLLSAPLTRLLRELTAEADAVNAAYIACRLDAIDARRVINAN